MNSRYTYLAWDSDFMGFKVCKLSEAAPANEAALKAVLGELQAAGVKLSYLFLSPGNTALNQAAIAQGGLLADKKTVFVCNAIAQKETLKKAEFYNAATVSPELEQLALQSGLHSRFKTDPGFKHKEFERMYAAWIGKSVSKELADAIMIYRDDNGRMLGFVSVQKKGDTGQVGLIAVDESARGQGIAQTLMQWAHNWYVQNGCNRAEVVTQLDNAAACSLYKKAGYSIGTIQHIYHFWNK